MERRSHRFAVLAMVVLLHIPVLFAIRDWLAPHFAPRAAPRPMVVEFVLNQAPPPPSVRRPRASAEPAAAATKPQLPAIRKPIDTRPPQATATPVENVRLFADDGSLRIPSTLSEDIAEKVVEGPSTFHIPAGDTWVLREPKAPLEYAQTSFARAFMPEDMNPVEEACWRNKGFAFIMTMLGSRDCANPGGKDPRPVPSMIVYGVDDADDILRKTEDWERYNER